jgi:hypothetical protein
VGNLQKSRATGRGKKTLNEGYFESGIELNQILKLGLTAFYRYGPKNTEIT